MSNNIISKIKGIVGEDYVIDSPAEMSKYLKGNSKPFAVVLPESTLQVSEVVKLANEVNLKITVGGKIVDSKGLDGGLAFVMSRMSKILEIDHANLVATVQPGLSHEEFVQKMEEEGLNFPPEPIVLQTGSIGGCFAIGDTDSKSFQYMPTRTYLLGYEMVLPTGEVLNIGNKCIKNVSGYDLIHFAVGSRGTLGIFTKLLIKLLPPSEVKQAVLADFASIHKASASFTTLLKRNIHPTRLNLINNTLAKEVFPGAQGQLAMVDLEGFKNSTALLAEEIAGVFKLAGGSNIRIITDPQEYAQTWKAWLEVRGKLNSSEAERVLDFNVGPMKVPQAFKALEDITGDLGSFPGIVAEGLLGHVRMVLPRAEDKEQMAVKVNALAMSLGGNVAGSLGSKLVSEAYNDAEMWQGITSLMGQVRKQFDPKGIFAPGVSL
ncbi:MAG: FAD-binding oxidoreductase [Desulfitobacteriaceae bacterium]